MDQSMQMRKLDASHLEQYNELLRYAFQVTDAELSRAGWEEEEIREAKSPILEKAHVLGLFKDNQLASQIATYPLKMNIHGTIFDMGLVTGVATYPEYAGSGLVSQLMHQALSDMRDKGQSISLLYPFSIPFYRHKGWELISDKMSFELEDRQLPQNLITSGEVARVGFDHEDLFAVHSRFAAQTHGCILRDDLVWEEYWRWEKDDVNVAMYYDGAGAPTGYMVYLLEKEVFHIKEMVCLNYDAWKGLWSYVGAHDSMLSLVKGNNYYSWPLSFWLDDSAIKETVRPYMMGRIVDVESFLNAYPFQKTDISYKITFVIKDNLLDWNNRVFTVELGPEGTHVHRDTATGKQVALSIGTLTTLLMGYKSASYLRTIERLEASDDAIRSLYMALPLGKPYISDYI